MTNVIGVGQLSLMDLNDAIISGVAPTSPANGSLWIDEGLTPPMLKKWNGDMWVDLGELDPDLSTIIEDINETLGNMANDNIINFQERQVIKDKLTEIIGFVIADTATTLPTTSTLDSGGKGSFWSIRKSATNVGILTSHATYTNVATRYNNLKSYLEGLTPIDSWDLRSANADIVINVVKSAFRDVWLQYYLAIDALATLTAQKIKENNDAVQEEVDEIGRDVSNLTGRVTTVESKVTDESIINRVTSSEKYLLDLQTIENKVARLLTLDSTSNIMTFDANNAFSPATQTITFKANLQNLTGTPTFTAIPYNSAGTALTAITLGGTGSTRTLTHTQFGTTAVRVVVTATLSSYSDTITVVKIKDGATGSTGSTGSAGKDAIVGFLTNESITLSANVNGVVGSFATANGVFEVYQGVTKRTGTSVVYSIINQTSCTVSITTAGVYSVTAMTDDTATATMRAVYGGVTIDKVLSLSKSRTGSTGATGADGKGVVSATVTYQNHTNGSTAPTTWLSTIPAPVKGQYLWTRTITTYTEGSPVTTYSVAYTATDGQNGSDGKGIVSTTITYQLHTNGTTAPTGTWVTSPPAPVKGQYLWTRTVITYTTGTPSTSYSTSYYATDGQKGDKGDNGVSVVSIVEEYYHSTSATSLAGGSWSTTVPTWANGKYVWTRAKTTLSSGSPTYTDPVNVTGSKGTDGTQRYTWVKYADDANGGGMHDSPDGKRYIGIAVNQTSATEGTTASAYTWSPLYDNVQVGGRNLISDSHFDGGDANGWTSIYGTQVVEDSVLIKTFTSLSTASRIERVFDDLEVGDYVLTIYAKVPVMIEWRGYVGATIKGNSDTTFSNDFKVYSAYFSVTTRGNVTIRGYLPSAPIGSKVEIDWFKLEKGNVATDWTPSNEEVEDKISILQTKVNNVENEITSDGIVTTITESVTFQNILDAKADAESLGDLATKEELSQLGEGVAEDIKTAINGIDFEPYVTSTELRETAKDITAKFSATGGMNLVKNSIGFAGLDFWTHVYANKDTTNVSNLELDTLGFGSAFDFPISANKGIHQDVPVVVGKVYTLSWYLDKRTSGDSTHRFYVQIQEYNGSTWVTKYDHTNNSAIITDGYKHDFATYTPDSDTIRIRFIAFANCEASVTGIMLNIGDVPLQWTLATGEVYNTNIKMDINGIRVSQLDADRVEIGYTIITPEEFAGYYDTDSSGGFEKVFYLNGEETVTKKLRALNEITMGSIKIIKIERSGNNGWAFVPVVE